MIGPSEVTIFEANDDERISSAVNTHMILIGVHESVVLKIPNKFYLRRLKILAK
jgi:hypothetical protein